MFSLFHPFAVPECLRASMLALLLPQGFPNISPGSGHSPLPVQGGCEWAARLISTFLASKQQQRNKV